MKKPILTLLFLIISIGINGCALMPVAQNRDSYCEAVKTSSTPQTAIVFVHGIFSDSTGAWTDDVGNNFPKMVAEDEINFPNADVFTFTYATDFSKDNLNIEETARNMKSRLQNKGVFRYSRIIFVCHSMGGLVVKSFLLQNREYAYKVPFIYFFATPHGGSSIANIAKYVVKNPQINDLQSVEWDTKLGSQLSEWLGANFPIRLYCAYERKLYKGVLVVDLASAALTCTEPPEPILQDHIGISKPSSIESSSYIALANAYSHYKDIVPRVRRGEEISDSIYISEDRPIEEQIQLYPEDKVKFYVPLNTMINVGGGWEVSQDREFMVIGMPGVPVVPRLSPAPKIGFKVHYTVEKYIDFPRDIRSLERRPHLNYQKIVSGDFVIDDASSKLASALLRNGNHLSVKEYIEIIEPIFNRGAFYPTAIERYDEFAHVLIWARIFLEKSLPFVDADNNGYKAIGNVIKQMVNLQNDLGSEFGTNFSIVEYFRKHGQKDDFVKNFPHLSPEKQTLLFSRNRQVEDIRNSLRSFNIVKF